MNNNHLHHEIWNALDILLFVFIFIMLIIYIVATILSNRHYKRWPLYRSVFWVLGLICVAIAVVGPLAHRAIMTSQCICLCIYSLGCLLQFL